LPQSPQTFAPDRYGKPPSAAGNNGITGSSSNGGSSSGGSGISNTSGGNNNGINGSGGGNSGKNYGNGVTSNNGGSASRDVGGGNISSILSTRVATTTVNSNAVASRNACKYPCLNGGTCQGSVCACRQGYAGENCGDRKCTDLI